MTYSPVYEAASQQLALHLSLLYHFACTPSYDVPTLVFSLPSSGHKDSHKDEDSELSRDLASQAPLEKDEALKFWARAFHEYGAQSYPEEFALVGIASSQRKVCLNPSDSCASEMKFSLSLGIPAATS